MGSQSTATLRCEDGTEIPFEWVYPDAERSEWIRDRSHWPHPLAQMELWTRHAAWPGSDRAWAEVGMEAPAVFYRFQFAGPFLYARTNPYEPERVLALARRYREITKQYGGAWAFWQHYAQPRIERSCRKLAAMPGGASLHGAAELWAYGFHQTFTSSSLLFEAMMRLTALLTESVGDDATLLALEVTQGGENASQIIDSEIWDLARLARETPAIRHILKRGADSAAIAALRSEPAAAAFIEAFHALVERHGSRSLGWNTMLPTWRERPEAALSLVRAQLDNESVSPAELAAISARRRATATERARDAIPPARHAEFEQLVAELDGYVSIREGRAYWQMTITGEMRGLLLRTGADLVARGQMEQADDILFLVPDDFAGDAASDLRALVADRRQEWERWRRLVAPAIIGTPVTPQAAVEAAPAELRGAPASRGEITGIARILHSPEDGARLQAGDVLVCIMTTPAWTPLFSVAGGIVTETGGPLSHPAITAREYGIPAVVAVPDATTRIRDGQAVTIDGGKGIITLQD